MSDYFEIAFAKADQNGSGAVGKSIPRKQPIRRIITLDIEEFKAFIKAAWGKEVPEAKVEEIFKKFDKDNTGSLDKEECRGFFEEIPNLL